MKSKKGYSNPQTIHQWVLELNRAYHSDDNWVKMREVFREALSSSEQKHEAEIKKMRRIMVSHQSRDMKRIRELEHTIKEFQRANLEWYHSNAGLRKQLASSEQKIKVLEEQGKVWINTINEKEQKIKKLEKEKAERESYWQEREKRQMNRIAHIAVRETMKDYNKQLTEKDVH